mmetsp:Transcript_5218/g.12788  ORF Transcript_5218/g.12788 Transcript_5218/m.12788 type:complete len:267 (-) Transcript_5218:940-1740(-)
MTGELGVLGANLVARQVMSIEAVTCVSEAGPLRQFRAPSKVQEVLPYLGDALTKGPELCRLGAFRDVKQEVPHELVHALLVLKGQARCNSFRCAFDADLDFVWSCLRLLRDGLQLDWRNCGAGRRCRSCSKLIRTRRPGLPTTRQVGGRVASGAGRAGGHLSGGSGAARSCPRLGLLVPTGRASGGCCRGRRLGRTIHLPTETLEVQLQHRRRPPKPRPFGALGSPGATMALPRAVQRLICAECIQCVFQGGLASILLARWQWQGQ